MGSQQLLLIAVGLVVVGIMVAVGMTMFTDQAISNNRDEIANDLAHFGAIARAYYRRPATFGGGEKSFRGLTMVRVTSRPNNDNGTYTMAPDPAGAADAYITLTGVGTQTGIDGVTRVRVVMLVYADSSVVDESRTN